MRIISKFHDYYDLGLSYGIDKTLIFKRVKEETNYNIPDLEKIIDENKFLYSLCHHAFGAKTRKFNPIFIGFCGRLIPCMHYRLEYKGFVKEDYLYTYKSFMKIWKKYKKKKRWLYPKDEMYETFFGLKIYRDDIFFDLKTPIFIWEKVDKKYVITKNPCLKDFKFTGIMDPYTVFQEISMYLGGVLGIGEKPIAKISNKEMIEQKGFDYKWSFRKRG